MRAIILILSCFVLVQCKTTKHIEQTTTTELRQTKTDSLSKVSVLKSKSEAVIDSSCIVTNETITTLYTLVKNADSTTSSVPTKQIVNRKITQQNAIKKQSTELINSNKETAKTTVNSDKKNSESTKKTIVKPSFFSKYWYWFVVLIILLTIIFKFYNFLKIL